MCSKVAKSITMRRSMLDLQMIPKPPQAGRGTCLMLLPDDNNSVIDALSTDILSHVSVRATISKSCSHKRKSFILDRSWVYGTYLNICLAFYYCHWFTFYFSKIGSVYGVYESCRLSMNLCKTIKNKSAVAFHIFLFAIRIVCYKNS